MSLDFPALGNGEPTGTARGHLSTLSLGSYATQLGQTHAMQSAVASGNFTPDDFPALGGGLANGFSASSTGPFSQQSGPDTGPASFPTLNGTLSAPVNSSKLVQEQQSAAAALAHRQGLLGQLGPSTPSPQRSQRLPSSEEQPQRTNGQTQKGQPWILQQQSNANTNSTTNGVLTQSQPTSIGSGSSSGPSNGSAAYVTPQSMRVRSPSVPASGPPPSNARQMPRAPSVNPSQTPANGVSSSTNSDSNHSPMLISSVLPPPGVPPRVGSAASSLANQSHPMPQTAAQQVFFSPADRFGLLGLLQMIKMADPDMSMLSLGQDLAKLGLDLARKDPIAPFFVTPYADAGQDTMSGIEPEFSLPSCYNVNPPSAVNKISQFTEETLFYLFYTQPRDVLQEAAAQALHQKNWRYHKELKMWLTKDREEATPSQKTSTYEKGHYIVFQPQTWSRVSREMLLVYDQLENRTHSVSIQQQQAATAQHSLSAAA